jgi:hypothetical protein
VNAVDNASNIFRITGVKLELGSVATPIQYVPFEEELARCMRYYQKSFNYATAPAQNVGTGFGTVAMGSQVTSTAPITFTFPLEVALRTAATVTTYNPSAANAQVRNNTDGADDSSTTISSTQKYINIGFTPNAANTAGDVHIVYWTADAEL